MDAGADVNACSVDGYTLLTASTHGKEEIASILIAAGAHVNAQGGYSGNARQTASAQGPKGLAEPLLAASADVNADGGSYGNALQVASVF